MILTYYQAVELMTFLPILLSPADAKTDAVNMEKAENAEQEADSSGIIEMWTMPTTQNIEVNGADFY